MINNLLTGLCFTAGFLSAGFLAASDTFLTVKGTPYLLAGLVIFWAGASGMEPGADLLAGYTNTKKIYMRTFILISKGGFYLKCDSVTLFIQKHTVDSSNPWPAFHQQSNKLGAPFEANAAINFSLYSFEASKLLSHLIKSEWFKQIPLVTRAQTTQMLLEQVPVQSQLCLAAVIQQSPFVSDDW